MRFVKAATRLAGMVPVPRVEDLKKMASRERMSISISVARSTRQLVAVWELCLDEEEEEEGSGSCRDFDENSSVGERERRRREE